MPALNCTARNASATKKAREAKASGADPTDYDISPTARGSFVPFYAQRALSSDCVLNGARGIQQTNNQSTSA